MHIMDAANLLEAAYDNNLGSGTLVKPSNDGAQAYLMADGTLLIPGTNELSDWTKYNLSLFSWKTVTTSQGYRFHSGFLKHANQILPWLQGKTVKRISGHSLGAASSQILAAILDVPAVNFAAPKVSWWKFHYQNEDRIHNFNRIDDRVTKSPRIGFRHLGIVHKLDPKGPHIGGDHSIPNYIKLLGLERYASLPQHFG